MTGMGSMLPLPMAGLSVEHPLPSIVVGYADSKQVGPPWLLQLAPRMQGLP